MNNNEKKLIELRGKVKFYKKLESKIQKVLDAKLEVDDWHTEVYQKNRQLETELDDLKIEMDLSDEEWNKDESEEE